MKEIFEVSALILSFCSNVPYIIETVQGKVKPERISWLLWTILGLTYYFSALYSDGATLFALGALIGPAAIFLLAIKFGVGGKSRFDIISLVAATVAFSLLYVIEGVIAGLLLALAVDGIGGILTARKLKIDPSSESRPYWGIGIISSMLAIASLETYSLETILFPFYIFLLSVYIYLNTHP